MQRSDEINMLDLLQELPSVAERAQVSFAIPSKANYDEMINNWILPNLLKKCLVFDASKNLQVEKTRDETQMGYQWYYKFLDALCRVKLRWIEIVLKGENEDEEISDWILQLKRGTKVEEFIKKFEEQLNNGECTMIYEPKEFDFQVAYVQEPGSAFGGSMKWAIHGSLYIKSKSDHSQIIDTLPTCNISYNIHKKATFLYSNQESFDANTSKVDIE